MAAGRGDPLHRAAGPAGPRDRPPLRQRRRELGLVRDGGEGQLSGEFIGSVVEVVRPHRRDGHGEGWRLLVANHDQVKAWLDAEVMAVKVQCLLARRGVVVPRRTVQRYAAETAEPAASRSPRCG